MQSLAVGSPTNYGNLFSSSEDYLSAAAEDDSQKKSTSSEIELADVSATPSSTLVSTTQDLFCFNKQKTRFFNEPKVLGSEYITSITCARNPDLLTQCNFISGALYFRSAPDQPDADFLPEAPNRDEDEDFGEFDRMKSQKARFFTEEGNIT